MKEDFYKEFAMTLGSVNISDEQIPEVNLRIWVDF